MAEDQECTLSCLKGTQAEKIKVKADCHVLKNVNDKMSGKVAASFEVRDNGVSGVIAVSDARTQKAVSENISLFTDSLSETENSIDIKVVRVVDISAEKYLKTSFQKEDKVSSENTKDRNNVQTKRLYQVAEGFIDNIRKIFGPDNL